MIQPIEIQSGELGHPMWKRNAFVGLGMCVVGIALICSVVGAAFGIVILAVGGAWALGACVVGAMQERADHKRDQSHRDHLRPAA